VHRVIPERFSLLKIDAAGIGLCMAASLVFYWVTIQPFLQRQSLACEQRRELKIRQDKVAEIKAATAKVQERLTSVQENLAAGSVKLEPAAHINKRVAGLTQFFSDCELDVDDVQTGRVYNGLQYDLVPITILGRGPYRQCVKFFHGLRSTFPDVSMARIELSRKAGQKAEEAIFQFDLLWYAAPGRSSVVQEAAGGTPTTVPGK
jgi:Tfp pilus assembly protein PilO